MPEHERKVLRTIKALLMLAQTNFPADTDVVIYCPGQNSGSVRVPSATLLSLLKDELGRS